MKSREVFFKKRAKPKGTLGKGWLGGTLKRRLKARMVGTASLVNKVLTKEYRGGVSVAWEGVCDG